MNRSSELPVKVLQFGTGRFIRAFVDCFIDEANRRGEFGGRIVMVASTGSGRPEQINAQNGQFTLWNRGLVNNKPVETLETITAVKSALSAKTQWAEVLEVATAPELAVICSNTTEIGLRLQENDDLVVPRSYPARLTAILHHRAKTCDYAAEGGLIVLPCELIDSNGTRLQGLVEEQARHWNLGDQFDAWLSENIQFCNSLVDRIVPGLPDDDELEAAFKTIGWHDNLITVAEPYRIWAIEGAPELADKLGFAQDPQIVVATDIAPYRIRKIRLLNGGHTLSVPLGLLSGCTTVLDNMQHPLVSQFIDDLLRKEIGPVLDIEQASIPPYIDEVLTRWRNPFMYHRLLDITLQSTTKMRHRVIPTVQDFYSHYGGDRVPRRIALGFAAWLLFMRGVRLENGIVYGTMNGLSYPINDSQALRFLEWWPKELHALETFVHSVLANEDLWGCDLTRFGGFADAVTNSLQVLMTEGAVAALAGT